jgi:chorismate dehydratase
MPTRLGAVTYLNARPLVYGLQADVRQFSIRFDVPSVCAALLHDREVELGLIPSIEYLHRRDYLIVPDVAVASNGTVASVALFSSCSVSSIRTIAVDTSSRTSTMLLRILCARHFHIHPELRHAPPDLPTMLDRCDAAMLIGDAALFADPVALGVEKIDFGEQWRAMTGLPFVYAFWAGWPGALDPDGLLRLREAKMAGAAHVEDVAREYFGHDETKVTIGTRYLTENVSFDLQDAELEGLRRFYGLAAELGFVASPGAPRFYFEVP